MQATSRSIVLAVLVAVVVTACGAGTDAVAPTGPDGEIVMAAEPSETVAAPEPDRGEAAPSTSTNVASPTTTAPTTTTTHGPDVPPTPIDRLHHYRWEVAAVITDDVRQVVYVESDGAYDEGTFECDLRVTRLNRTALLTIAGTGDGQRYVDLALGSGLQPVDDTDEDETDEEILNANLAFCPGAPEFWKGLGVEGQLYTSNEIVERNDEVVQRLDLTAIPAIKGFFSPLGPPGQTTYDRYTLFITENGGWINAMEMSAKVGADAIGELADREPGPTGRLDVKIDIFDGNDDSIEVDDPGA